MGLLSKFFYEGKQRSEEEEIVANLSNLFNTKEGFGAWQKHLGLRSYSYNHSKENVIKKVKEDIAINIEMFDGRVELISIEECSSPTLLDLYFKVKCCLHGSNKLLSIAFNHQSDMVEVEIDSEEVSQ